MRPKNFIWTFLARRPNTTHLPVYLHKWSHRARIAPYIYIILRTVEVDPTRYLQPAAWLATRAVSFPSTDLALRWPWQLANKRWRKRRIHKWLADIGPWSRNNNRGPRVLSIIIGRFYRRIILWNATASIEQPTKTFAIDVQRFSRQARLQKLNEGERDTFFKYRWITGGSENTPTVHIYWHASLSVNIYFVDSYLNFNFIWNKYFI